MKKFDFAIITPSYTPDFERCRLLSWSIQKFISPSVTHYILVERQDELLFSQLQSPNTKIHLVESLLPWWIQRIPFFKNGWLSLKTPPIRNWIMQQIIKIASAQLIDEDILVFVDSDVAFVRPFNLESLIHFDRVRLFREHSYDAQTHIKGHEAANKLLGLPNNIYPTPGYIGNVITWRRDNVLKLYQHLESISGKAWIETLGSTWYLAEYVLYGVFVDHFLKEESGHYYDSQKICYEYWLHQPMSDEYMQKFFAEIQPHHVAVMISSKAGIPVERYEPLVKTVPVL
ncbi:MAG: hypothetical protein DSM106950_33615 [Stigonema ocellatum SAG 48.90 = DSM 106950]|nr:hypothetical protein [Stigonema ocellatum SAG 48.90 = DSM 106950]